jgi:hypothetical protein
MELEVRSFSMCEMLRKSSCESRLFNGFNEKSKF